MEVGSAVFLEVVVTLAENVEVVILVEVLAVSISSTKTNTSFSTLTSTSTVATDAVASVTDIPVLAEMLFENSLLPTKSLAAVTSAPSSNTRVHSALDEPSSDSRRLILLGGTDVYVTVVPSPAPEIFLNDTS